VNERSRLAAIEGPVTRGDLPAHRRADIEMAITKFRGAIELLLVEADCSKTQCEDFRAALDDAIADATAKQLIQIAYEEEGGW
jgi:hypothetical protein